MDRMLEGTEGATAIMDDILVVGESVQQHDKTLKQVIEKGTEYNLKLNFEKCQIRQSQIPYIGHIFTGDGLKPDPSKVLSERCQNQLTKLESNVYWPSTVPGKVHTKPEPSRRTPKDATQVRC